MDEFSTILQKTFFIKFVKKTVISFNFLLIEPNCDGNFKTTDFLLSGFSSMLKVKYSLDVVFI